MQKQPPKPSAVPLLITLLIILMIIAGGAFLSKPYWQPYLTPKTETVPVVTNPTAHQTTPPIVNKDALFKGQQVLNALKANDYGTLASIASEKGIRFTLGSHIDTAQDLVLSADQIKNAANGMKKYTWGIADGSGAPIVMTISEYFKAHVYDKDFITAPDISDEKILGTGNTINNQKEVYPSGTIVEYHFPGFDPQYGGMDWESLRLVFEKKDSTWVLVGIIHDQWSI